MDDLEIEMMIVSRCRGEGAEARLAQIGAGANPYTEELERAAWDDGWCRPERYAPPPTPAQEGGR